MPPPVNHHSLSRASFAAGLKWALASTLLVTNLAAALAEPPAAPQAAPQEAPATLPEVSATAWAITDGQTGRLLWGQAADEPRKSASTTKVMCALVVLELAARDPRVLGEMVTFSELADATPGSTANIQAGESLPVADCLYALLLPSGNDAGNALAEHFHPRLQPPDDDLAASAALTAPALATRANFLAEMNRTARRLELERTVYRSPYGDGGTENDRTTTAHDLTRLAWHALQIPRFRQVVGTRRYECHVWRPDGTTRVAVWQNTNRLLGREGYDGVKTGTTSLAGSCLVSSGRQGDGHLLVAVLGSKSDNDRYADTEALFRWAWDNLAQSQ